MMTSFNTTFLALLGNNYVIPVSKFSTTIFIFVPPGSHKVGGSKIGGGDRI